MGQTPATSPFATSKLLPIEDEYKKEGKLMGLRLPTGEILINYEHGTKNSVIAEIAKVLKAEVVVVSGTWTFTPHKEAGT